MAIGGKFFQTLKDYEFRDWIRIIVIVCGYILMRQQFVKWRTRRYQQQQEEEDDILKQEAHEEAKRVALEKMDPKVKGSTGKSSGAAWGWGNTAKERFEKRRKYIEKQAMRKAEMAQNEVDIDSDDEINELLH